MRIMFSSPGRRVELISFFKKLFRDIKLYGADFANTSPALYFLDKTFKLPKEIDSRYANKMLEITLNEKIDLIIPLIDPELYIYSINKKKFQDHGISIMVSDPESIEICTDKMKFYDIIKNTVPILPTTILSDLSPLLRHESYLFILKPRFGSSSRGIYIIKKSSLIKFGRQLPEILNISPDNYVIQPYIEYREEITVDVLADLNGTLRGLCQRKRLKVRGGEVERGVTVSYPEIERHMEAILNNIKFEGVINIQFLIDTKEGKVYVSEINPRFGGGYPLSFHAGADFITPIVDMYIRKSPVGNLIKCREGFYMFRYDEAVYTQNLLYLIDV